MEIQFFSLIPDYANGGMLRAERSALAGTIPTYSEKFPSGENLGFSISNDDSVSGAKQRVTLSHPDSHACPTTPFRRACPTTPFRRACPTTPFRRVFSACWDQGFACPELVSGFPVALRRGSSLNNLGSTIFSYFV
jgi:hypothetical protein